MTFVYGRRLNRRRLQDGSQLARRKHLPRAMPIKLPTFSTASVNRVDLTISVRLPLYPQYRPQCGHSGMQKSANRVILHCGKAASLFADSITRTSIGFQPSHSSATRSIDNSLDGTFSISDPRLRGALPEADIPEWTPLRIQALKLPPPAAECGTLARSRISACRLTVP